MFQGYRFRGIDSWGGGHTWREFFLLHVFECLRSFLERLIFLSFGTKKFGWVPPQVFEK